LLKLIVKKPIFTHESKVLKDDLANK